jgi:hypothetical protein
MLTKNLLENILIRPGIEVGDELCIVSASASPAMAYQHLDILRDAKIKIKVNLIIGMSVIEGIPRASHTAFNRLVSKDYPDIFKCSYLVKNPPIHSNIYAWLKRGTPSKSFIGSANYTQAGFGENQREVMVELDPEEGFNYYSLICGQSKECRDPKVESLINIHDDREKILRFSKGKNADDDGLRELIETEDISELFSHIEVCLVDRRGDLPARSGLNWGQRPEYNRNPNQAYIRLDACAQNSRFFPEPGRRFVIFTDDGESFVCIRAQANGKAIETPEDNSLLGIYFRKRLGLKPGAFVQTADLDRYGRTGIDFYRIDEETYYLDYSARNG